MAETSIEWVGTLLPDGTWVPGFTFNPWWGCEAVSPACKYCYAEAWDHRWGGANWGGRAPRRFFGAKHWAAPLRWDRVAAKSGVRRRVFCMSMGDIFEERDDLDPWRHRLWKLIEATPHLDWLLLTKRPENQEMVPLAWQTGSRRPANVWLGTTAEDQEWLERRAPLLLSATWPSQFFLSYEPALGQIDVSEYLRPVAARLSYLMGGKDAGRYVPARAALTWVIAGGESGPSARPANPDWFRSVREQCAAAGVPFLLKQLGGRLHKLGGDKAVLDGRRHLAWPAAAL